MTRALRSGLWIASGAWLLLGVAALAYHSHWETPVSEYALILPAIPLYLISSALTSGGVTHGLLWDSAHGPPFLTVPGVVVVYVVLATVGLIAFRPKP